MAESIIEKGITELQGDWTPVITGGTATGITFGTGKYVISGKMAYVWVSWSATEANSDKYLYVSGFPFSFCFEASGVTMVYNGAAIGPARGTDAICLYFTNKNPTNVGYKGSAWLVGPIA